MILSYDTRLFCNVTACMSYTNGPEPSRYILYHYEQKEGVPILYSGTLLFTQKLLRCSLNLYL